MDVEQVTRPTGVTGSAEPRRETGGGAAPQYHILKNDTLKHYLLAMFQLSSSCYIVCLLQTANPRLLFLFFYDWFGFNSLNVYVIFWKLDRNYTI